MTLDEYYAKCETIAVDFPPPEGSDLVDKVDHYKAIKDKWKKELSPKDLQIVLERNRRFSERMSLPV